MMRTGVAPVARRMAHLVFARLCLAVAVHALSYLYGEFRPKELADAQRRLAIERLVFHKMRAAQFHFVEAQVVGRERRLRRFGRDRFLR
ncbi:MAG: hypothetical protein JNN30_08385 [Rhodanobacteraceae bacterium]|nr:hypothetical protein [Rhodanobacteraceae bacterium]